MKEKYSEENKNEIKNEEMNKPAENKMGIMPIDKLLISVSLPMIISMIVQALYNIVDSVFVSKISENALTAVSLAFPMQILTIAVGAGTGVGINALLSRRLGEKKFDDVNKAATNGIFLIFLSYIAFALIGIFLTRSFFAVQTDNAEIIDYGTQYLRICLIMGFGIFGQMKFERLLQSTGKSIFSMITQGTGAIINLILDPIMIFGYFGFPKMGVAGAALATVTGQIIAMILGIIFNIKYNKEINFSFKGFRPDGKIIKMIYSVGIPAMIMQAIGSVMTYSMNKILLMFSPTAVAVFGVYFKLQSFIFMPVFGLNNGVIPIVAYNYGIRNKKRIMDTIKLSMIVAVLIMICGVIVFETIPDKLLLIFDASDDMVNMGTVALRIIGTHFVLAGFSIIIMSVFQAFGEGMVSLIVSISRQLVVLIPVAYIFAKFFGLDYVWLSFPIAEIVALTLCLIFFKRLYNKKIKNLSD